MTKKRTRFWPNFLTSNSNSDTSPATALLKKLLPWQKQYPRYECTYCSETKRFDHFVHSSEVPVRCHHHLGTPSKRVCRSCIEQWLSAQLEYKSLLEISCPECSRPWDPESVRYLIGKVDEGKFRVLEDMAKGRALVPRDVPEKVTMEFLLSSGARFCPWCRWLFIKDGGCDAMQCVKCLKCFNIAYALVLEDEDGNRAGPVLDDADLDLIF